MNRIFLFFGFLICGILLGCGGSDTSGTPFSNEEGDSESSGYETDEDFPMVHGDMDSEEHEAVLPGDEETVENLDVSDDDPDHFENDSTEEYDEAFEAEEAEEALEVEADDSGDFACDRLEFCPSNHVCNLALGRCEKRSTYVETGNEFFDFHPKKARNGDLLVIDGQAFYTTLMGNFSVKVWIGPTELTFLQYLAWDENRLLVRIPNGASGKIGVQCENGFFLQSAEDFESAPEGVLTCDDSSPQARGVAAEFPTQSGPYAPAYLDYTNEGIRVFYPASCGSLRRPGVAGSYPLVTILHGNGAGHVNYEYLGQLLASRGFVVINPPSTHTNQYDEEVIRLIKTTIETFHDRDLGTIHQALSGLSTNGDLGFICHSRGCGREQELLGDYPSLAADTLASVYLGPVGNNDVVPGAIMVFGGTVDGQSFASYYNGDYQRQSAPKWKIEIQGGNHSLFADAKTYSTMDGVPSVSRQRQLAITASFAIPFMERAFGKIENHAEWLDNPPASSHYTVESDP